MIAVTKRFQEGPIISSVITFPDVFSVAKFRLKSAKSRSEPRVGFRLAAGEFGNY